ncbi:MAG: PspC domain-containing protein [Tannerella sp.]|jgi:phage shock protein PspC (stress-responsive transcriptional regulator)|nr:PspC domain-containing protein [Tannerella sp.]
MKKTLTVNLGGIVFHIDEDAYQLLENYLSNLRIHFSREEGSDEIMNDFEARISELLHERIKLGFQVISIEHVEEVVRRMGKPEEIFAGDGKEPHVEEKRNTVFSEPATKVKKRLMRDPDDCMLGGVASGLAAYFGCDVTVVRLLWVVLFFLPLPPPSMLIIYLILWLCVPKARTAADRLIMRGENVNLTNIGRTVTDSFEKVSHQVNGYLRSDKPRSTLQKIADFIVSAIGIILKIGIALTGIILIPFLLLIVFVLLVVAFALIAGGIGTLFVGIPWLGENIEFFSYLPEYLSVILSIGGVLLLGIPLVALIYLFCIKLFKIKPMSSGFKWGLVILWMIALIACGVILRTGIMNGYSFFHYLNS